MYEIITDWLNGDSKTEILSPEVLFHYLSLENTVRHLDTEPKVVTVPVIVGA